ncbi:hydrogenase maturation nickel metallochaperone HypA/HybF [Paenibacillus sp. UNC451MF]|uniref:hydrogenase maturation nickel metallochaperone HypA/HybF n=1 Tax=Paenibacillus sp. UNC451MF TaxID=1449063 RepID=UPI00048BBB08|nr:hydrogenase maturation nickel metallochaperone HypA [Paenibacillus sp. UNC451MF]
MHELALMGDIVILVEKDAKQRGIASLTRITLVVGVLSNAMPDALLMAFDMFKAQRNTMLTEDATLKIITEEADAFCPHCQTNYEPTQRIAICPDCSLPGGQLIKGQTFQVESYEGS